MANLTRINNNQITDAVSGNVYTGINANAKIQPNSITSNLLANNLTYGSDLTITGNLSVTGNVTAIDTTNTTIEDPLLLLASTQTGSPAVDIGFIGQRGTADNVASVWDESSQAFVTVFTDSGAGDNTTINILSYADFITGNVSAIGNVNTGNLNVSSIFPGEGSISAAGNITASGNLTLSGGAPGTGTLTASNVVIADLTGNGAVLFTNTDGNVEQSSFLTYSEDPSLVGGNLSLSGTNSGLYATGTISTTGNVVSNDLVLTGLTGNGAVLFTNTDGNVNQSTYFAYELDPTFIGGNINLTGSNSGLLATGTISTTGNVISNDLVLTGLTGNGAVLFTDTNGNVDQSSFLTYEADPAFTGGNLSLGGTNSGLYVAGIISASGNVISNDLVLTSLTSNGAVLFTNGSGNVEQSSFLTYEADPAFTGGNLSVGGTNSGLYVAGTISASGNVTLGSLTANGAVLFTNANGNVEQSSFLTYTNDITGIGGNLSLTGLNSGVYATGPISTTGNVYGATLSGTDLSLTGNVISLLNVTSNIAAGNIFATETLSAGGNVIGGNLVANFDISATGMITGGNIQSGNTISAFGNIITDEAFVGDALYGNSLVITSTSGGLEFAITGNINVGNTWINNLAEPYNNSDAATKAYVDGIANGLQVKASSNTASTGNIVTMTGSTYVYDNGTAGVGATITLTNTGVITIDNVVLTAGMRVLIKDEPLDVPTDGTTPSAAYNGIYDVTTAGAVGTALVLTRSIDDDVPGQMYSAYTFVTSPVGSTNSSSGWASTNTPTFPGPLTVGTTFYIFVQFSQAGSYSAGNALSLTGSTFNALVDVTTIAINGSNQLHIPANATLTTPNIGNAYGTSLSVTGSITGNVSTVTTASVTGDVFANNVNATTNISAGGNVTVGYPSGDHTLSVFGDITTTNAGALLGNVYVNGLLSAQGNITSQASLNGANLSLSGNVDSTLNVTGTVNANSVSATGNVTGNNVNATNSISAGGNVTANNVSATNTISATGNVDGNNVNTTNSISAGGNVTAANFTTTGSAGNISGANVIAGVTLTASGNVYAGSFFNGDGGYISNINGANVSSTKISNGSSFANIATPDGNIDLAVNSVSVGAFYNNGLSLTGNATAGNVTTVGVVTATGNVTGGNINTAGLVTATGNVTAGNLLTAGLISATGNATAGNVTTVGVVTATGTITGGNFDTAGNVSATGNLSAASSLFASPSVVTVGTNVITTGATFAINATDSMLLPVGNTLQRPTGSTGMLRWNTTLSAVEVFTGAIWTGIGSGSYTVIQNEQFDGDGTTVEFTLGSSQTTNSCIVTINGVVQIPTTAYSVSGVYPTCVLTFTEAPEVGDTIDVREITSTTTVTAISNTSGNSSVSVQETTGQVDITGNLVAQVNSGAPSLASNQTMSFQLLSNTSLAILVRGTDGVTRSTTLTLS